ncbi:MAG: SDR family oxidoreductase [Actinobacteria bacterium]|nr:SDR family oxidoreductase [Actinomycetota bacterium]
MNDKKNTALVTGGAGFIGSHLCKYLLKKNYRVICADDLITGTLRNLEDIKSEDFIFINHDITEYIDIKDNVSIIFHLASPASPIDYLQLPIQTLKVGALGTHNILGLAKSKRAIMLLASTSEVYGDPLVHPQDEGYWGNVNPIGPRGVYDEAKRFSEAITMAYHRQQGLNTRIARIFNTYGPNMRMRDGRVIPNFIIQCLKGEEITIYGNGNQTRSFCYVDDMVEGLFKLSQVDYSDPVNLGNPDEWNILRLADKIKVLTESESKIIFNPLPVDDPKVRMPNTSKAKKILNWEPKISLEEGLLKTIGWFKKNL